MNIDWKKSVIVLSGGFDPIHKGHMRMFREAANLGHQVIVGLNSDAWLARKKGKPFMKFYERKEILEGIKYIAQTAEKDDTKLKALFKLSDILDLEDKTTTNVQQVSGAVFQGFSKDQLESAERKEITDGSDR